ncbi:hypothetical protein [Streptomyces aureus]|uniref:hypothetical protein n=1 Tax=Streptomyces aureus TaxID=193461 RepID=UPI0006E13D66|nr:hypothetical protein [Streptomyces aureus]
MPQVYRAEQLLPGDYVRTGFERFSADGPRAGEYYARIEHVEHVERPDFVGPDTGFGLDHTVKRLVAVRIQGMPGPVLLRAGDHHVARAIDEERQRWDRLHPTWPEPSTAMFVGGKAQTELLWGRTETPGPEPIRSSPGSEVRRRPRTFEKRAGALRVGDYLQTQTCRFPAEDMGVDEGFWRVEWIAHLEGAALQNLLADPAWARGRVTLANVYGISGVLVIPETSVRVLVVPNPERLRNDLDGPWRERPYFQFVGATVPNEEDQQRRDAVLRSPAQADEADLYPSAFSDPADRELFLNGVQGIRPVPASQLPWPHRLSKCRHFPRVEAIEKSYPDDWYAGQVAHAELFARLTPEDFAACPYHQGNWAAIAEAATELAAAQLAGDDERERTAYAMEHLDKQDRQWARALVADPICWDDNHDSLTNGQHRTCALRAAGVPYLPVEGRHLPHASKPDSVDARTHAQQTVHGFWRDVLTAVFGPAHPLVKAVPLLMRFPILRLLLSSARERRE